MAQHTIILLSEPLHSLCVRLCPVNTHTCAFCCQLPKDLTEIQIADTRSVNLLECCRCVFRYSNGKCSFKFTVGVESKCFATTDSTEHKARQNSVRRFLAYTDVAKSAGEWRVVCQ